jgi:hypothetical protein
VGQLLVAAAAVVVVGVGIGQVLDSTGGGEGDSSSAEVEAGGAADDTGVTQEDAPPEAAEPAPQDALPPARRDLVALTSSDFEQGTLDAWAAYSVQSSTRSELDRGTALLDSCRAREWGPGAFVPVTYDGAPGVLVFRRALGDTQVADLFLCGDTEPRRSVTLPAG